VEIPGLGPVVKDEEFGWYTSGSRPVAALGGASVRIVLDGFEDDPDQTGYVSVLSEFLGLEHSVLMPATDAVFDYYQDVMAAVVADEDWDWYVDISSPDLVWDHVTIGRDLCVRRHHVDRRVYLSIECECDWEPEHGLQIVIREGRVVSKVGPYNGHLTNASAYGLDDLAADVVYHRIHRTTD
jgi:hypothetical protein